MEGEHFNLVILIGLLSHDRLMIMADSQAKTDPFHSSMDTNKTGN